MKTTYSDRESDPLDALLRAWTIDSPLPPGFQERVWSRISREEARRVRSTSEWWMALVERFGAVLRQPLGATVYLSAFLLTGAALGYWGSEQYGHRTEASWRTAYLHSVTPALAARTQQ